MSKQKICITGALGYIGTELCQMYAGEAWYKDIVAIDNRFVSERVKQLTDWGIKFIHGDVLDADLMAEVLASADLVYHLAGVTDVAYTKTQENEEKDNQIRNNGIYATKTVLANMPPNCKIIFPSTHVIFEGLKETKFNLTEEDTPLPELTYAIGKYESEKDIRLSGLNHVIVRLGSVYGYSSDTMRINIMPNLFSKIASQDGTIKLFSGGVQYKSLVAVNDVVRAMKFFGESKYERETFNLSNENITIKDVALICKKHNEKVTIIETDDEIPNLGYTLSNAKLLDTGFTFRYNIDTCIKEMISKWSAKEIPSDLEYIMKGGNEYVDNRGEIRNYELSEPINLIGYITSKRKSVRANHYHPIQEQKCLLIKGRYISVTKDLTEENSEIEYKLISEGDIAVIKPNVAHAMVFIKDSIFLNLVRGEREHENYGVTHTLPYHLADDTIKYNLLKTYVGACRVCGGENLMEVLDLGMSPLANSLTNSPSEKCELHPLEMERCLYCWNVQLSIVVPPEKLFDNYLYLSSTSSVFVEHFAVTAKKYVDEFKLNSNSVVWDIGSNDGIFLKQIKQYGVKVCGIEPAKNLSELANSNNIFTLNGYFDIEIAKKAFKKYGCNADIITASNVFAHSDDLRQITKTVFSFLKYNGVFIIEVQYLMDTIKDLTFDNIYHEHVNYWSVTTLSKFFDSFDKVGYSLFRAEHIDTHGGSIRCYVRRKEEDVLPEESVQEFIDKEGNLGIHDIGTFIRFKEDIEKVKKNTQRNIKTLTHIFPKIAAYGSPAKATTALNYFGITSEDILYTVDDNPLKVGKFIPKVNIPIVSSNMLHAEIPDVVIVLAWNFYDSIVSANIELINKGVIFISIKDLYLDNIEFASFINSKYNEPTQIGEMNRYIVDYTDFSFNLVVGSYWGNNYKFKKIEIIHDCYRVILDFIKRVKKDKWIIDIGANCGIISVPASMLGYNVVAFEPVKSNTNSIIAAIKENNLISLNVLRYALSDVNKETKIYVPECLDNASMSSNLATANMANKHITEENVTCITFDSWIKDSPEFSNIGLIKIDVQGHEPNVIRGMKEFLSNCSDVYVVCEFDKTMSNSLNQLYDTMIGYGFNEVKVEMNEDKIFYKK